MIISKARKYAASIFAMAFAGIGLLSGAVSGVCGDSGTYGPRYEIGLGGGISRIQSRPEWSSKHYGSGALNFSCRIFRGFSVHVAKELHYGTKPRDKWLDYGPHFQINTEEGGYRDAVLLGARYDIPVKRLMRKNEFGIHTVYIAGGYTWDAYKIQSTSQRYYAASSGWETGQTPEPRSSSRTFEAADLTGYYVAIAARWRIDTIYTEEEGSWIGAYGVDVGLRYTRYTDSSPRYANVMKAGSNFNTYQVFVTVFFKFNLLY